MYFILYVQKRKVGQLGLFGDDIEVNSPLEMSTHSKMKQMVSSVSTESVSSNCHQNVSSTRTRTLLFFQLLEECVILRRFYLIFIESMNEFNEIKLFFFFRAIKPIHLATEKHQSAILDGIN